MILDYLSVEYWKKPGISAGYFGKLPDYPDFIKYNAGGEEIACLDKWLQEGIVHAKDILKAKWKDTYKNSSLYSFIYPFTGTKNVIMGHIYPGYDRSEREFPFLTYLIVKRKSLKNYPLYLTPFELEKMSAAFNLALINTEDSEKLSSYCREINNIAKQTDNELNKTKYQEYVSHTSITEYFQRTFQDIDLLTKNNILEYMIINLSQQQQSPDPVTDFRIKLSLTPGDELSRFDIGFIIHIIQTLSVRNSNLPSIFWATDNNSCNMYIIADKPSDNNYLDLIDPDSSEIKTLNQVITESENMPAASSDKEAGSLIEDDKLSLQNLIDIIKNKVRNGAIQVGRNQ